MAVNNEACHAAISSCFWENILGSVCALASTAQKLRLLGIVAWNNEDPGHWREVPLSQSLMRVWWGSVLRLVQRLWPWPERCAVQHCSQIPQHGLKVIVPLLSQCCDWHDLSNR